MAHDPDLTKLELVPNDQVASAAARELIQRLAERQITDGLVVDLGCGTGTTARMLNEAGYAVLGVDIAQEMIDVARRTAPASTFVCASLFEVEIPECVAVTAIGESINYAIGSQTSSGEVSGLVERIHEALIPGGVIMLDAAGPDRIEAGVSRNDRFEGPDWELFVTTSAAADGLSLSRDVSIFRRDGELWRRTSERHEQQLYSPETITERLLFSGFHVVVLSGYDSLTFPEGWAGFLGHKRR